MAITITTLRGLTDTEYTAIQHDAKQLAFPVNLRIHRQRYAYGALDIRPTKRHGSAFTPEEVKALITFCTEHRLLDRSNLMTSAQAGYLYRAGFHYLRKLA